jgi:hypothetical protein
MDKHTREKKRMPLKNVRYEEQIVREKKDEPTTL